MGSPYLCPKTKWPWWCARDPSHHNGPCAVRWFWQDRWLLRALKKARKKQWGRSRNDYEEDIGT